MNRKLTDIFAKLFSAFGKQYWWPADNSFEVMVGAILTQNTNWSNVEKAISCLKKNKVLEPKKLFRLPENKTARLIRSAGYYNIKARRLKEFLKFFFQAYQGDCCRMASRDWRKLRQELLMVKGIGPETADSILLYALHKPVFVVDAYTKRILQRHGVIKEDYDYHKVQDIFMRNLKKDVRLFNEYHALLVKLGKGFCLKSKPRCAICPLNDKKRTLN